MSEIKIFSLPEEVKATLNLPKDTQAIETNHAAGIISSDAGMEYDMSPRTRSVSITNSEGFSQTVEVHVSRIEEILSELTTLRTDNT